MMVDICRLFGHTNRIQERSSEHSLVWTICRRCGKRLEEKEKVK